MPLQNRVTPEGDIIATPARGTMMGNRGGPFHSPERRLGPRRWKTKAWICCVLEFKGRHRVVMSPNRYTELFFLDEATALAAGHRPCFECRRGDAVRFAEAWRSAHGLECRPRAGEMDEVLHRQRTGAALHGVQSPGTADVPDGAFVRWKGAPHLVLRGRLLSWNPNGYERAAPLPARAEMQVITPRAIIAVLAAGYRPALHPSAHRIGQVQEPGATATQ